MVTSWSASYKPQLLGRERRKYKTLQCHDSCLPSVELMFGYGFTGRSVACVEDYVQNVSLGTLDEASRSSPRTSLGFQSLILLFVPSGRMPE